jgi:lysozyme
LIATEETYMDRAAGIDVSQNDGVIDWKAVARAGYSFAFIRASYAGKSEGKPHIDRAFVTNWRQARDQGLLVSAYHYFVVQQDSTEQVEFFLNTFGARKPDFALTLDFGYILGARPKTQVNQFVSRAVQLIETQTGRKPMIYTGDWWWQPNMIRSTQWADYDLWAANYNNPTGPILPPDWKSWKFWQWSDEGRVPGIATQVDLNWFSGSAADLKHYADVQSLVESRIPPP